MKRGKLRIGILTALTVMLGACLIAACGEKNKDGNGGTHEHSFGEWSVSVAATCTEGGELTRSCSCGEKETQPIPPLGHDYDQGVVQSAPTCTEDGELLKTCTRCSHPETEVLPALGHSFGEWSVQSAPTCTEDGERIRTCSRCSHPETEVLPAKGHDWDPGMDRELEPATCIAEGKVLRFCLVCEKEIECPLPATGHSWNTVRTTEPDCETTGTDTRTCTVCGTTETAEVPALGHKWRDTREIEPATCTDAGKKEQTCERCGDKQEAAIAPLGHNFEGTFTVDKRPSFTAPGEKSYHCTRCDARNEITVIPMLEENTPILYEFSICRNNGDYVVNKSSTVTVKDEEGSVVLTSKPGETAAGIYPAMLLPKKYTVTLSDLPDGYYAEGSYTVEPEYPYCKLYVTNAPIQKPIPAGTKYKVGDVMYDFTYQTVDGKTVSLTSMLEGKKGVMLNFFYTTCQWCNYEFPGLNKAYLRYRDDIEVLAIDPYSYMHDSEDAIRSLVKQYSLSFLVASDKSLDLHNYFSISGYPASVFIDAEGVITRIDKTALVEDDGNGGYDSERLFADVFARLVSDSYWENTEKYPREEKPANVSFVSALPVRRRKS